MQCPTSLLAQVDASVGGKTGVNHDKGKNLIGAFHQPAAVVIDSATLSSLAPREFNAGLAEVVKYGAIRDEPLFEWLEANVESIMERDAGALEHLIHRSVVNKAEIVSQDEREAGIRAILNFGHTFGHAIESETAYSGYLHGEAVAMGMVTAAHLSEVRGLCPAGTARRVSSLLQRFELPVRTPAELPVDGLCRALDLDKKAVASGLRLVLLEGIGHARLDSGSPAEDIRSAIAWSQGPEAEEKQE